MTYQPLDGVRVLDLARMIGGDHCTAKLADMGAEVVKVEVGPHGDYARQIPPRFRGESYINWTVNRGKKSIELDLKTDAGRATFLELAEVADVIVEVSRPGTYARLGIDFAELRRRRPELVVCSLTGFGQTGPLAGLPSHGMSIEAMAGTVPVARREDGRWYFDFGTAVPLSLGLELGAMNAAVAILAALLAARATGEGAWIDMSFWDAAVEARRYFLCRSMLPSDDGFTEWTPVDDQALYAIYEASDGRRVLFAAQEQKFFATFCDALDRPDLLRGWVGDGPIAAGAPWLRDELEAIFATAPAELWLERFVTWDIPGAIVLEEKDIPDFPHTIARGLIERDWVGPLPKLLSPIRWMEDGSRPGADAGPCSAIGADTEEVLRTWLRQA